MLKGSSDATGGALRFGLSGSLEVVPQEVLLLGALEQVDLARVVIMDEAPAASVNEFTAVALGEFAFTLGHMSNGDLARRKQVDARNSLVADSHLALERANIDANEVLVVSEERLVGRSHGELELRVLGEHAEASNVSRDEGLHLLRRHPFC